MTGAAKRPILRPLNQARADGISMHIRHGLCQMVLIADKPIIVVGLPERARATKNPICAPGSECFPAANDAIELMAWERLYDYMYMIGHDNPRQQAIRLTIVVQQRLLDQLGDACVAQGAASTPRI